MKNLTILLAVSLLVQIKVIAQDTLYYENFNPPNISFVINSSDLGGAGMSVNYWQINNSYTGGTGQVTCLGIPFSFNVPNTNAQPGSISGSPNSNYLHMVSDAAVNSGVTNCTFQAADGLCTFQESYFSKMSLDISTIGYDTVTFSFWWLCGGGANSFGELYYSTDGGVTWVQETSTIEYKNSANWTKASITNQSFAGINSIRFGFRFFSDVTTAANDPGFGIDDIVITGKTASLVPNAYFYTPDTSICSGDCISFTDSTSNGPTMWEWLFPGATPVSSNDPNPQSICYNTPGNYDVTLIVANSNGVDTLTISSYINVNAAPPIPVISQSLDTLCTTDGYVYQWYFNGITPIPGAIDSCYQTIFPGTYTVTITDSMGCSSSSLPHVITSLYNKVEDDVFMLYPNPAENFVFLEWQNLEKVYCLELISLQGKLVRKFESDLNGINFEMDLTSIPAGTYLLKLLYAEGSVNKILSVVK